MGRRGGLFQHFCFSSMGEKVSRSNPTPLRWDAGPMYNVPPSRHPAFMHLGGKGQYELGSHPKAQKLTVDRSQIQTAKFGV